MPAIRATGQHPRGRGWIVAAALILIVGLPVVHLARGGTIAIPFTDKTLSFASAQAAESNVRPGDPPGYIRVPISARAIAPYAQVSRDDLIDTQSRSLATFPVREESLAEGVIRDPAQIIGRVLKGQKGQGYLFRERDFLAEGTRPGMVAGIPAGKRAFRLDVSKIEGLFGLQIGDRFDVVASVPIDSSPASAQLQSFGGIYAPQLALEASFRNLTKAATVKVLVQNGVVVTPAEIRHVPVVSSSLTQGQVTRTKPIQEIVIAIDPEEVAAVTEALAIEANVTAFARSGRPDDPVDSVTPVPAPRSPFSGPGGEGEMRVVETISGSDRQLQPTPATLSRSADRSR